MLEMATVSCGWQVFNEKKSIARLKLIPPAMSIKIAIPPGPPVAQRSNHAKSEPPRRPLGTGGLPFGDAVIKRRPGWLILFTDKK